MAKLPSYVLITPAWNEAEFIEQTIRSVTQQTVQPLKWVVVSDGSTDETDDIVSRFIGQHEWIELIRLPPRTHRDFAGKAKAFMAGYARVKGLAFEVIGNLDADVSFADDYLEFLLDKFAVNPRLGVAGTPYRESGPMHDERFKSPDHVSGACQMFRRECFEEIGGYQPVASGGIDLIALFSAQAKGWETKRFDERSCIHHRRVGSGQHSATFVRLMNRGKMDYVLGSHPAFELFRALYQMRTRPYVLGGVLMLVGYAWALASRTERTMPKDLIQLRQRDQLHRLAKVLRHPWRGGLRRSPAIVRS